MKQQALVVSTPVRHLNFTATWADSSTPYNSKTSDYTTWTNSRSGFSNFEWAARVAAKLDASSSYTMTNQLIKIHSARNIYGRAWALVNGKRREHTSCTYSTNPATTFVLPTLLNANTEKLALSKFYRNLQKAHQQFDGLTFLGELAKTKHMVFERGHDLFNLMVRGGRHALGYASRVPGSRRKRKIYTNAYLESTFGWLPLFSEMKNLGDSFEYETQPVVVIRSKADYQWAAARTTTPSGVLELNWLVHKDTREEVVYSFVAGISPEWDRASSLGLSMRNIATSLWELTPWSFAIDYFVDVQGWLISRTYSNLKPIYSVKGVKQVRWAITTDQHRIPYPNGNLLWQGGNLMHAELRSARFTRTLLGALPQMKGPSIRGIPSAKQLLNLGALYLQRDRFTNL